MTRSKLQSPLPLKKADDDANETDSIKWKADIPGKWNDFLSDFLKGSDNWSNLTNPLRHFAYSKSAPITHL